MYTLTPFEYLDSLLVDYTLLPHTTTFTAQDTARSAHIKGRDLAKVIVVGSEKVMSMVVVPANYLLLQNELSQILKMPDLTIVPEFQFAEKFPECELGAMPPFGKLYGMEVFLAKELARNNSIIFNGGTHNLLIKMRMSDFRNITDVRIISSGYRAVNIAVDSIQQDLPSWQRL